MNKNLTANVFGAYQTYRKNDSSGIVTRKNREMMKIKQNFHSMHMNSDSAISEDQQLSSTQYASTFYGRAGLDRIRETPSTKRPITAGVHHFVRTHSGSNDASSNSKGSPTRTFPHGSQAAHDTSHGSRADLYINNSFVNLDSEQTIKQRLAKKNTSISIRPKTGVP